MPRFPPRGPHGRLFPRFDGTIKALRLPAGLPAAFRFLHLAVPQEHACFAPTVAACRNGGPGVGHPESPSGLSSVETAGSPKFLGNPIPVCPCSPTPAGRCVPDRSGTLAWPSLREGRRRRRRKSFEAQSHGFRARCLRITMLVALHRARLASRRWSGSPGRAFTRKVPLKVFNSLHVRWPPFPSFLAQSRFLSRFLSPFSLLWRTARYIATGIEPNVLFGKLVAVDKSLSRRQPGGLWDVSLPFSRKESKNVPSTRRHRDACRGHRP